MMLSQTLATANDITWFGDHAEPIERAPIALATQIQSPQATERKESTTMAFTMDARPRSLSKFKRTESLEFRLIFVAAFAVFLVTATVERLLPLSWFKRGAARKSIVEQAKEAANTCAAYAFMG